jgi:hypothetical protein
MLAFLAVTILAAYIIKFYIQNVFIKDPREPKGKKKKKINNGNSSSMSKTFFSIYVGPLPLPLLGNVFQVSRADKISFVATHKLASSYGSVAYLWLGTTRAAVVTGSKALKVI